MSVSIPVRVAATEDLTPRIKLFTLVSVDGSRLPAFTAGSHIAVETTGGLERQYSICNDPSETDRYLIAVQCELDGRGGSKWMHENVCVGDTLRIKPPLNNFPLGEKATHHLLIAGGIGVTPILSMARDLARRCQSFDIVYLSRSKPEAAFLDVFASDPFAGRTTLHHDLEAGQAFDLAAVLGHVSEGAHIYCCGPAGLMKAVEQLTKGRVAHTVHFEKFSNDIASHQSGDRPLSVVLAKSKTTVDVRAEQTILDALLEHGIDVDYSCCEGTCGTCVVKLLDGIADHRDAVLSDDEKGKLIAICCSRAKTPSLTLDI